ncbi:hypothetical protein CDAR_611121 [Caerostris darwini]|uniref:Uncharacterized protein n=1 Tax=Caerostris darwini TaxID=1538125 RepID=A0AAV4TBH5_9ARAC|nr:hypothetical protein CDAR_611121 [Caerostris darwini]
MFDDSQQKVREYAPEENILTQVTRIRSPLTEKTPTQNRRLHTICFEKHIFLFSMRIIALPSFSRVVSREKIKAGEVFGTRFSFSYRSLMAQMKQLQQVRYVQWHSENNTYNSTFQISYVSENSFN